MNTPNTHSVILLASMALASVASAQIALINDDMTGTNSVDNTIDWFGDNNYNPETRTAFFTSSPSSMIFAGNYTNGAAAVKQFTPQTLAVGDSLSMSWRLRILTLDNPANIMRVGFLNSNGVPLTDQANDAYQSTPLASWTGMFISSQIGNDSSTTISSMNVFERATAGQDRWVTGTGATNIYSDSTTSYHEILSTSEWTPVQTLSITRTATGYDVTTTLGGSIGTGGLSALTNNFNVASASLASFDAIGLWYDHADSGNNAMYIDDVLVEYTAVPEPGAYALIGGFLALSWVMVRRRKVKA